MSNITKLFLLFFIAISFCLVLIGVDLISSDNSKRENIQMFTSLSKLPNSVLSVSHFEPRIREYKDDRYSRQKIDYIGFSRR